MHTHPIGLSLSGAMPTESIFQAYQKAQIDCMELSCGIDGYEAMDFAAVSRWAKTYGIELWSMHLPFVPFAQLDPSSPDRGVRDQTLSYFHKLITKGTAIGIRHFIIHPSGEPIADEDRREHMRCAQDSLAFLAQDASLMGATLCVEDLPRTCLGHTWQDMAALLSADSRLRVCFDTNHLLTQEPEELIQAIGSKIVTLHVSDYDKVDERHWLPGEGVIKWQSLYRALEQVGYAGPWLYELGFSAPPSVVRDRDLTCEDFVTNAREIFAGQEPHAVGKALPNLPMGL